MLGKILFVIVLPISGSCRSMVYRSVIIPDQTKNRFFLVELLQIRAFMFTDFFLQTLVYNKHLHISVNHN